MLMHHGSSRSGEKKNWTLDVSVYSVSMAKGNVAKVLIDEIHLEQMGASFSSTSFKPRLLL
jgi:hypothetical protein